VLHYRNSFLFLYSVLIQLLIPKLKKVDRNYYHHHRMVNIDSGFDLVDLNMRSRQEDGLGMGHELGGRSGMVFGLGYVGVGVDVVCAYDECVDGGGVGVDVDVDVDVGVDVDVDLVPILVRVQKAFGSRAKSDSYWDQGNH
jgi:hypothetical protein